VCCMQQICKHVANDVVAVALDADVDVAVAVDVALLKCAANLAFDPFDLLHPHTVAAVAVPSSEDMPHHLTL